MNYSGVFLVPGKILFLGFFAWSLIRVMQAKEVADELILKLCLALLAFTFYQDLFASLERVGEELITFIEAKGATEHAFYKMELGNKLIETIASKNSKTTGDNSFFMSWTNYFGDALKSGVWGVVAKLVDLIFILSSKLLVSAKLVLWQLLIVLFPLTTAMAPVTLSGMKNIILFAVELILWVPLLKLVDLVVAATNLMDTTSVEKSGEFSDFGLGIIATELVAIILIFSIPSLTHKVISNSLGGDLGAGPSPTMNLLLGPVKTRALYTIKTGTSIVNASRGPVLNTLNSAKNKVASKTKDFTKRFVIILIFLLPIISNAAVKENMKTISLFYGYVTKLSCRGKLEISSLGNPALIEMAPLPADRACALLLRPLKSKGSTNLVLETSTGSIKALIKITKQVPRLEDLSYEVNTNE